MTLEHAKQELIKRYKYLYENACFILAPYMYEQSQEDYKKIAKSFGLTRPLIYLKIHRTDHINTLFEEFLLSDIPMKESTLYQLVEKNKSNKEYLEDVKKGIELLEKENSDHEILKMKLTIWEILEKVSEYIKEQSGDLKNKERKLTVIDEYYKIARYQNNGKIYTSGRDLNFHDCDSFFIEKNPRQPRRDKLDVGIKNNPFIKAISLAPYYEENWSIFTENEKQQIYLEYHDELPCDLEIACKFEEAYIPTTPETRLYRPENTSPCRENFIVKEEEIFVNPSDTLYRYYQLCPHCGYIVNIPKEILSEGIKQRIEDRCNKDDKLFRKMFLYSELFSLDKRAPDGQKKLLKK